MSIIRELSKKDKDFTVLEDGREKGLVFHWKVVTPALGAPSLVATL